MRWLTEPLRLRLRNRGGWQEDRVLDRDGPPFGPRNTWSNLAYLLAGTVLFLAHPSNETGVLWAATLFLTAGSGLYHAYKSAYYNAWDHNGMYAVFGALAVWSWGGPAWLMALAGFGIAWVSSYWRRMAGLDTQVGVLLAVALYPILRADPWYGITVISLYGVSYLAQRLDKAQSPLTSVWGHAIWHGGTAGAIWATGAALGP